MAPTVVVTGLFKLLPPSRPLMNFEKPINKQGNTEKGRTTPRSSETFLTRFWRL